MSPASASLSDPHLSLRLEIVDRIDRILDALGILDKKHSIIGSPERKVLSGGQRKRVNIALELISDTPVLFLDEPTSGLSSYDAAGVVDLLKRLSQQGKTIIATIHQPSLDAYRKFDNLIMISRDAGASGALTFYGPAFPDAIEFFRSSTPIAGIAIEGTKPGDLTPETLLAGLASRPTTEWSGRYAASHYHQQFVRDRAGQSVDEGQAQPATTTRGVALTQWVTLFRRNLLVKSRDRAQTLILLLQAPLFAALIVLIFGRIDSTPAPGPAGSPPSPAVVQAFAEMAGEIVGIEFLMVVAAIWFGCNNAARDIVGEWTIFQRERMVSVKLPSYVFSKFALMCGLCLFQCLVLLTVVYVFCGLRGNFVETALVLVLSSLVGAALGLAISSRSASTESAIALLPVVLLPVIALGGGIRAVHKMPEPARSLSYAVPSRWAFESTTITEAHGRPCGYFPGDRVADTCAGGGVDAAYGQIPDSVSGGPSRRFTFTQTVGALGGMLVLLLGAVLAFLKMRDIH
jgi:ABC-type cobalamin/Fe3+-siderophores transport system ATPase subunit/ABC-type multidrug transport system permease subunit